MPTSSARFVADYLVAHREEGEGAQKLATQEALTPEDKQRLQARYEAEAAGARAFLRAEDAPAADRRFVAGFAPRWSSSRATASSPLLAWPREIVDAVVSLEQAMLIFRQRHARMVERVIGRRTGTGGSAGVDYLDQTALKYRVFSDVWAVRTLLLRRAALPRLEDAAFYDFRGE